MTPNKENNTNEESDIVVDAIGIEEATGDVILTIGDYSGWDIPETEQDAFNLGNEEHLQWLQEQLNAYLRFIDILSGSSKRLLRGFLEELDRRLSALSLNERHAFLDRFAGEIMERSLSVIEAAPGSVN